MIKNNKYLLIILISLILPIVSANGLTLINQTSFDVNKTFNINKNITFQLKNEEPVIFKNINFEENTYIAMNKIDNLSSGSTINVTATIISDSDFSGTVKLKGFYESQLGSQNLTHFINVSYTNGLTKCDFSITKGDSINWNNLINISTGDIKLMNAETLQEVTTISYGTNYSQIFETPISFPYYFSRYGFRFTDICTITVLDTSGLINDPNLDALITLDIEVEYEVTDMELTVLTTNYSMTPSQTKEDILSVKNIGSNIAKNIKLSGEWILFSTNNFDLDPGESKNIGYTIVPNILLTNETNKTHLKNISIEGNFLTLEKNISIFIHYMNLGNSSEISASLKELMENYAEIIKAYCNDYPDEEVCSKLIEKIIIGEGLNETGGLSLDFVKGFIDFIDQWTLQNNRNKENQLNMSSKIDMIVNSSNSTNNEVISIKEDVKGTTSGLYLFIILVIGLGVLIPLYFVVEHFKVKKEQELVGKYY
tara:strand:- start:5275 stop:6720 length:1446 start_codon:yes stop_codon:yes gene_type:complete